MKLYAVSFNLLAQTLSAYESCSRVWLHLQMNLNAEKSHGIQRQINQTNLQT